MKQQKYISKVQDHKGARKTKKEQQPCLDIDTEYSISNP